MEIKIIREQRGKEKGARERWGKKVQARREEGGKKIREETEKGTRDRERRTGTREEQGEGPF